MAYRPKNPQIAAAMDFAEKFKRKAVIILDFDKSNKFFMTSYGEIRAICEEAKDVGNQICDAIEDCEIDVSELMKAIGQYETFHKRGVPADQWPAEFQKDREIAKIQKYQSQVLEFQKSQWRLWNNMDALCRRIVRGELCLIFPVSVFKKILRPETKKMIANLLR